MPGASARKLIIDESAGRCQRASGHRWFDSNRPALLRGMSADKTSDQRPSALFLRFWGEISGEMCYVLGMSTLELSTKYAEIGSRVIKEREDLLDLADVRIAFLASDQEKKSNWRTIFGECRKVSPQYAWCCPYDFMITIYEPNCVEFAFSDREYETLIYHELLHCGVVNTEDGPKYRIIPHDIEEFETILEKEGLHWQRRNLRGADPIG